MDKRASRNLLEPSGSPPPFPLVDTPRFLRSNGSTCFGTYRAKNLNVKHEGYFQNAETIFGPLHPFWTPSLLDVIAKGRIDSA